MYIGNRLISMCEEGEASEETVPDRQYTEEFRLEAVPA